MKRNDCLVRADRALLLVVDLQEAFATHIEGFDRLVERARIAIEAAKALSVPVVATEQYPQGLGRTVAPIRQALGDLPLLEKTAFSCLGNDGISQTLLASGRKQILLAGIETHVCILQTACDLLAMGYRPCVLVDTVGSRRSLDHETALGRMRNHGVTLSTTETAILEMVGDSRNDVFKQIRPLIR